MCLKKLSQTLQTLRKSHLQANGAKIILNLSLDISKYPALFWEVLVRNLQGFTENTCILRNIRNSEKNLYIYIYMFFFFEMVAVLYIAKFLV